MARNEVMRFKVKGWMAAVVVAVLVVVVLISGYYRLNRMRGDSQALQDRVQNELYVEYAGAMASGKDFHQPEIEIQRLGIRGGFNEGAVIQVEFTVDGKTPPGSKGIRYYRTEYSTLTGWRRGLLVPELETLWNLAFPR